MVAQSKELCLCSLVYSATHLFVPSSGVWPDLAHSVELDSSKGSAECFSL